MKNYFKILITCVLLSPTSFASCSLDTNAVCSLPQFRQTSPQTYTKNSYVKELSKSPANQLQPIERTYIKEQILSPSESNAKYNSSCQFGVCLQNRSTPLFQQRKQ